MNVEELHEIAAAAIEEREKFDYEINVCMGTGCLSQHSDKVKLEGKGAVTHTAMTAHNGDGNANMPAGVLLSPSQAKVLAAL